MTENKRFKNVEEKLDWGTIQYFTYNDKKLTDDEIEDLVNLLLEENRELKKRDDLVSSYIRDEGSITLEKYDEIVDYLYKEWKKKRDLNDRE